jgi:hypothetical protein
MSKYNWCHNPDCHTIETQSRVRGTGDNKVLRTIKIKVGRYNYANDNTPSIWDYFCNQGCLMQFLNKFCVEIANTYSVKQPSETPIKVIKEKYETTKHRYTDKGYEAYDTTATRTTIERANNE